ncbi:PWWP domain-containing DNA repair factor 3A isoform 1-T2 [Dama dama]|uniref:PWWP domain-containing DNA repair factor 3A n=1 Tax=Dama dama TaxID=30532 RepID=UPI002A364263|nr:PWWP domain-containing DNA repair factor 3A [Dama dama]XP_061007211.1 PWWP domain-containing DNA repair factor 3A [Dama dama]
MTDAKYVLCRWKKRLWPAKVLAGTEKSAKNKRKKGFFLNVQILSLDKKIKVKSAEAKVLRKVHIEDIASSLASQDGAPAAPLEELAYRRSLRVALDVLNERQGSSSREGTTPWPPRVKPVEPAPWPHKPSLSPSFLEDTVGSPGPTRREHVSQRLSSLPAGEEDLECRVDPKEVLRRSGGLDAPAVCSASGGTQDRGASRKQRADWMTPPSKQGRNPAQGPCSGQRAAPSSEGASQEDGETGAGLAALCSPPGGRDPSPQDGCPAERLGLDGGQKPRAHMGPHSPAQLGPAEEAGDTRPLEEARPLSEEFMEPSTVNSLLEEDEDDEEPPRILLYHEPRSFEVGMLVWHKYQKYPFWPAVVKSVRRRDKKASVLFIEGNMNPRGRGISVLLRRLKHFDCKEKQALLDEAKEDFAQAIGWCVSLITDYRVRLGCGSFAGSFLEYYAADISSPVRKSIQQDVQGTRFPQLSGGNPEEPVAGSPQGRRPACRKVLPDRSRAARDRANQKLVEYIVKARGAESHLRAILRNRKPSRWLKTFLSSGQYMTCVETYLEDEEQLDLVVKYLQGVYKQAGCQLLARGHGDGIRFILDVLLPEAIICAISAVDAVDYKTAEEKYIRGPALSSREKEIFDNQLLEERNRRC